MILSRAPSIALVLAVSPALAAQAPDAGAFSAETYTVEELRGVMVPMRDGVRLSLDIYRPKDTGRAPVILVMTPYDNTGGRENARWFARRGYAVAQADVRGRYDSEGEWDPWDRKHRTDGYDLVEWLAAQPWSNGRVGMMGGSYLGLTQWWTAITAPPALKAIVPLVSPPDAFENFPYQHGVLVGGYAQDWAAMMSGRTNQSMGPGVYGGWNVQWDTLYHTPYIEINEVRGMRSAPWLEEWYRQNKSSDPYWQGFDYQGAERWSKMTVPSLNVTGWFDANQPGAPMNYVGMKAHAATVEGRRPSLIIGPWVHGINQRLVGGTDYGPGALIDWNGYVTRWFDHWLKGMDNGVERDPPVHVFVMGENVWRAEADWPLPQTEWTDYYLDSGGHANSLKGDGVLRATAPGREGSDTYTYDPRRPTRDVFIDWPQHNGHIDGALDTRIPAVGDEVLVYRTAPLEQPVEVVGPIEATLFASTSARDTDWMVRLVDLHPDGYSALLAEGVMRARNRNPANEGRFDASRLSVIEPDRVYEYTIRFWRNTANVFMAGHRIGLEISSSWAPYYLPNLNTGQDNLALVSIDEAVVATQRVFHGTQRASRVVLPVIRRRR